GEALDERPRAVARAVIHVEDDGPLGDEAPRDEALEDGRELPRGLLEHGLFVVAGDDEGEAGRSVSFGRAHRDSGAASGPSMRSSGEGGRGSVTSPGPSTK